ncbi:hypothetical protein DL796_01000 [Kangiella spongicola]|uniref:Uncharacterized protein n=1 Tax=Kangiella spongicola TaxID=796379 RepID=A0A318D388_9GAMM|nr:hypothetical protein DL796_01000 [Kangiella spongicola]
MITPNKMFYLDSTVTLGYFKHSFEFMQFPDKSSPLIDSSLINNLPIKKAPKRLWFYELGHCRTFAD